MSSTNHNAVQIIGALESTFLITLKRVYTALAKDKLKSVEQEQKDFLKQSYMACISVNGRQTQDGKVLTEFNASISLAWDLPGYLKMAEAFMGESYSSLNEENIDIGAEILNTVVGNSKRRLGDEGILLEMAIPTHKIGDNSLQKEAIYQNVHSFQTELGEILFHFSLNQADAEELS